MELRWLTGLLIVLLCNDAESAVFRVKRQISVSTRYSEQTSSPSEARAYKPPLLPGAPSVPVASSATLQNSYQPPISLLRSNEYHSPIHANPQHQANPAQPYVLPKQAQSYSVLQQAGPQHSYSVFQQPPNLPPATSLATSYSVRQQAAPAQSSHSIPIFGDTSGPQQSTAERTYSTHSKVVGSSHVPVQAIHKAPASEIESDKGSLAKDKDNKNDEYVVYYYYYYDNDTTANNNLSLNFDDIPSLEAYDNDKLGKEPEKASVNSLAPVPASEPKKESPQSQPSETSSSQPRSVSSTDREAYIRSDSSVQPLKPVSNVFRYGSNEVPRFPVLPNFVVAEPSTTVKPRDSLIHDVLIPESPTTQQPSQSSPAASDLDTNPDLENDDLNNVLDNTSDLKASDDKVVEEEPETTTTTTTEPTTTTEITTTTTERSRRRPSLGGGGRRRFNSPAFSSNRNRQSPARGPSSSTSSTTSTTTPASTGTRGAFRGSSRFRPRPPVNNNRPLPRGGSRTTGTEAKSEGPSESTTTATTRSRAASSSRRFQSSRSRPSTTSTTTSTPSRLVPPQSRSRPTPRPRPGIASRTRPRPGFLRPRPGVSEPEEPETTTPVPESVATESETSVSGTNEDSFTGDDLDEEEEEEETSEEQTEAPTTTEANRFSALFRPRNRNLGNRPRPVIGNRPSRP